MLHSTALVLGIPKPPLLRAAVLLAICIPELAVYIPQPVTYIPSPHTFLVRIPERDHFPFASELLARRLYVVWVLVGLVACCTDRRS